MLMRKHGCNAVRLVSAMAAFALVIASVIGAYAHAAGHNHADAPAACAHQDASGTTAAAGELSALQDADEHCSEPASDVDSFDFMCNGGIAILVTLSFAYVDPTPPYSSAVAAIALLLLPASLERPPRSPVLA
jgi:hypothetical protein